MEVVLLLLVSSTMLCGFKLLFCRIAASVCSYYIDYYFSVYRMVDRSKLEDKRMAGRA